MCLKIGILKDINEYIGQQKTMLSPAIDKKEGVSKVETPSFRIWGCGQQIGVVLSIGRIME